MTGRWKPTCRPPFLWVGSLGDEELFGLNIGSGDFSIHMMFPSKSGIWDCQEGNTQMDMIDELNQYFTYTGDKLIGLWDQTTRNCKHKLNQLGITRPKKRVLIWSPRNGTFCCNRNQHFLVGPMINNLPLYFGQGFEMIIFFIEGWNHRPILDLGKWSVFDQ